MPAKPRPALELATELQQDARRIRAYLAKIEALRARGELGVRDVEEAYCGALLTWHTSLERHVERLFVGLLLKRLQVAGANVRPRMSATSDQAALDILSGDRRYVDWLPIDKTKKRAGAVFQGGRPFDRLTANHKHIGDRLQVIRNAIAHRSDHATCAFRNFVVAKSLPPSQRRPAGYLRGAHSGSETRIEFLMTEGAAMVKALCQPQSNP